MNIFDVIGGNKGLQEDHVTAVLGWLLDSSQSHGCGALFLEKFFKLVGLDDYIKYLNDDVPVTKGKPSNISVETVIEFPVSAGVGDRFIDIVILIVADNETKVVTIENKIRNSSVKQKQLAEQLDGLKAMDKVKAISMVYLTPEATNSTKGCFDNLQDKDLHLKKHIEWERDIKHLLVSCLEDESKGYISPMSYETRFVLKSLVQFISNDFKLPAKKQSTTLKVLGIDGLAKGLEELKSKYDEGNSELYIGFMGGLKALEASSTDYLESRRYKYLFSLEGGKYKERNWIKAKDFFNTLSKKGLNDESI